MRILFLSTWFPWPPDNGSKIRVYHLLRALAERHEVTLVSFAFGTARPDEPSSLSDWCTEIRFIPVDPYRVNKAGPLRTFLSPRPVVSRPVPAMSQLVANVLRSRSFDVVICSTGMMIDYTLTAPPGAVRILEEHNAMTRLAWERSEQTVGVVQRTRRRLSWQKDRWYEARTYPTFDMITMVSEADQQATLDVLGRRGPPVEVVLNGVDCARNRPGLTQPFANTLVFNGSLTYDANFDAMRWFLAEVYPQIKAEVPEVTLAITGSIEDVDLCSLALDESVTMTGYVEDVRVKVAQAEACVAPIRHGGGTRLKILESMALGTPVVATRKGAEGLAVTNGENILIADDPQLFAAAILRLVEDPKLRQRLATNARRLVEAWYDWEQIGMKFVSLVEETLARKREERRR